MKCVLIQQGSGAVCEAMLDVTYERHKAYCQRHGFAFVNWRGRVLNSPDRGPSWCRLDLLRFSLLRFDLVVVLDADTLIVDRDADFREALPENAQIGMVRHPRAWEGRAWHWNCGVIVARAGFGNSEFWGRVITAGKVPDQIWNEQSRLNQISLNQVRAGEPEPFYEMQARWNSAAHINPCPDPVVKAWHGLRSEGMRWMVEALFEKGKGIAEDKEARQGDGEPGRQGDKTA